MYKRFDISKQCFGYEDYEQIFILGCHNNQECKMKDPNKPICDLDNRWNMHDTYGMCIAGVI